MVTKTITCGDWDEMQMEDEALSCVADVTLEQYGLMVIIRIMKLADLASTPLLEL